MGFSSLGRLAKGAPREKLRPAEGCLLLYFDEQVRKTFTGRAHTLILSLRGSSL